MTDLVSPTRVAGAIEIFDNAFNTCDLILEIINARRDAWRRSFVGADAAISHARTSDSAFLEFGSLNNPVPVYEFGQLVWQYLDDYARRYAISFAGIEPACINRYQPGQEYLLHADDGPAHPRIISALIYLNDVPEGGETHFPLFNETVSPMKGRLVIFPSNYAYVHEARPPKRGLKYSMAIWTTPVR